MEVAIFQNYHLLYVGRDRGQCLGINVYQFFNLYGIYHAYYLKKKHYKYFGVCGAGE